jgi:UDPglucose 6-dehydrogenase
MKDYKVIMIRALFRLVRLRMVHSAVAKNATVEFDIVSNPEFLAGMV